MARVLGGVSEPDEPDRPDPEVDVRMTVPQDFTGWSMPALSRGEHIVQFSTIT
jgi:hypothetical protein